MYNVRMMSYFETFESWSFLDMWHHGHGKDLLPVGAHALSRLSVRCVLIITLANLAHVPWVLILVTNYTRYLMCMAHRTMALAVMSRILSLAPLRTIIGFYVARTVTATFHRLNSQVEITNVCIPFAS
jgi:hypothetical protein